MDGVGLDVGVITTPNCLSRRRRKRTAEGDVDDDEVMDVVEVGADLGGGQAVRARVADDEVAGRAVQDLVVDVVVQAVLPVGPFDFDLFWRGEIDLVMGCRPFFFFFFFFLSLFFFLGL